jgi:acyl-CoA reductase-like NAD-dependent aldehyde dehydrogenase
MCTTTQNIYVPRDGVRTEDGTRTPAQVAEDLGAALDRLLGDDEKAAGILGAIVNDDVAARLDKASGGPVAVASRQVKVEAWPDARIRTPLVLHASAEDRSSYSGECFGPISYLVETESRDQAVEIFEDLTRDIGALSAGVYSTDEAFLEQVRAASFGPVSPSRRTSPEACS